MHTRTPGATVISILGDSLSSTEGRCQAYRPWPMLLQDSLGTQAFTVHGFALPGVAASGYRRQSCWQRALQMKPSVLAIMLGTNDARVHATHSLGYDSDASKVAGMVGAALPSARCPCLRRGG